MKPCKTCDLIFFGTSRFLHIGLGGKMRLVCKRLWLETLIYSIAPEHCFSVLQVHSWQFQVSGCLILFLHTHARQLKLFAHRWHLQLNRPQSYATEKIRQRSSRRHVFAMGHTRSDSALSTWKDLGYMILHGFTCIQCTSHNIFRINKSTKTFGRQFMTLQACGAIFVFPCVSSLPFMLSKVVKHYHTQSTYIKVSHGSQLYQPSDSLRSGMAATNFLADCKHLRGDSKVMLRSIGNHPSSPQGTLCRCRRKILNSKSTNPVSGPKWSTSITRWSKSASAVFLVQTCLLQCLSPSWTWTLWTAKHRSCKHRWYSIRCLCLIY